MAVLGIVTVAVTLTAAPLPTEIGFAGLRVHTAPERVVALHVAFTLLLYESTEVTVRVATALPDGGAETDAGPVRVKSLTVNGTVNVFVMDPDVPCTVMS